MAKWAPAAQAPPAGTARVAFDGVDGPLTQRKTQLDINRSQCVAGFEDEDVDQVGQVFGVVGEFVDSLGYECPQVGVGVVVGLVVDGSMGLQWVHGAPLRHKKTRRGQIQGG